MGQPRCAQLAVVVEVPARLGVSLAVAGAAYLAFVMKGPTCLLANVAVFCRLVGTHWSHLGAGDPREIRPYLFCWSLGAGHMMFAFYSPRLAFQGSNSSAR